MKQLLLPLMVLCLIFTSCHAAELPSPIVFPSSNSPEFDGPFLDKGSQPVYDATSYKSENISLNISSFRYENSDVYVVDLYVRTLDFLCRSFKNDDWQGGTLKVAAHAEQSGALLAITGDSSAVFKNGLIVGNGILRKSSRNNKRDLGILWRDGSFNVYKGTEVTSLDLFARSDEIWQTFLFGPYLLDRETGHAMTSKQLTNAGVSPVNPRSIFGYYEPGHYCLVLVDGRKTASKLEKKAKNRGITIEQTSQLMEEIGVTQAYNLDGGQSAQLVFLGESISNPYNNGRRVGDAIVVIDKGAE